jgi:hypothetical protein
MSHLFIRLARSAVPAWRVSAIVGTLVVLALIAVGQAADLSGTWWLEFEIDRSSALYQSECSFRQEGDRLTGACLSGFESTVPVRGRVMDAAVTFQFSTKLEGGTLVIFSGTLDGKETTITGTWQYDDQQGNTGRGTFTAVKR